MASNLIFSFCWGNGTIKNKIAFFLQNKVIFHFLHKILRTEGLTSTEYSNMNLILKS